MDPTAIIALITAAIPVIENVIKAAEAIGADVTAHKSALQTFEDAFAALTAAFSAQPLPAPAAS